MAVRVADRRVGADEPIVVQRHRYRDVRRAVRDAGQQGGERETNPIVEMDDVGPLATEDLAHSGGDLRVVEVDGPEGRLRQELMGQAGQVRDVERREAIDDDAFGRDLASRPRVEAGLAGDNHDLVLGGQGDRQSADIDLRTALHHRRGEIADEADLHAAFSAISPTRDISAASILLT